MCVLHECEERGVFTTGGRPWSDEDIAVAVGGDIAENLKCLHELLEKGVARRNESGAVYSRRMVRDEQKRKLCQEAGKKGGNPALKGSGTPGDKQEATPRDKPKPTSSVSSSSSSSRRKGKEMSEPPPPEAVGLASKLKELILKNNQNARVPTDLSRWAEEAERLLRIDQRPVAEAAGLLEWCQKNIFWRSNILSMEKFRMQYDRLFLAKKSELETFPNGKPGPNRSIHDRLLDKERNGLRGQGKREGMEEVPSVFRGVDES